MKLENKKIVITGASSGIGFELLKLLSEIKGTEILAVSRNIEPVEKLGLRNVTAFCCDVSKAENVDRIFEETRKIFSGIDVFFANAGFAYYERLGEPDISHIEAIFNTNVFSVLYSYEKFKEMAGNKKACFAVTASAMGFVALPGYALYASTKFALNGFQESVQYEKPKNLQFTTIFPVATKTDFFKRAGENAPEPFPVQSALHVAKCTIKGIEKGKKQIFTSRFFRSGYNLWKFFPFIKSIYINNEKKKFENWLNSREE